MSVLKNYIYNTLYQVMLLFIPLFTMPYLTRIFSPNQLGINTYTLSIANYFMLFGMLGMQMYGNRQIAYIRNDKKKLRTTFWSLYCTQLVTCFISLALYYIFISSYIQNNKSIYLIQGINVVGIMIDISWLFMGLEDFKKVVIRNTLTKVIGIVCIFTFVKGENDLNKYILISALINVISNVVMWMYIPKNIRKIDIDITIIRSTIKPLLLLFLPQIATQVYGLLAKTMVGALSTNDQVAFYDYSQRIVKIVLALITSLGIVLLPRISNIIGNGNKEEVPRIIEKTFKFVSYISIPMSVGLICISGKLVSWFLGLEYMEVGYLTAISSLIIIPVSWANIIGVQYLIGTRQENKYTKSIIIAAIINVLMNVVLIRPYGALGAIISLVVAEYTGVFTQMILLRKQLDIYNMLRGTIKYFISSLIMGLIVIITGGIINNPIIANIAQVIVGIIIYTVLMCCIKDESQKEIISKLKKIISNEHS